MIHKNAVTTVNFHRFRTFFHTSKYDVETAILYTETVSMFEETFQVKLCCAKRVVFDDPASYSGGPRYVMGSKDTFSSLL